MIVDAGPAAVERFLEFFAAAIANDRTRAAYGRAAGRFLAWCGARGLGLRAIAPLHVAAYIRTHPGSVPTVKQHLAAIRALCDWLVVHQVLPVNPAAAVRGPKHVVTKGATPVLTPAETRALLDRIDTGTRVGLRDRALLSVMVYSFARVSAAVGMRRQDYFRQGTRGWLRLHEKGGKRHDVPAHQRAEEALEAYVVAGGRARERAAPLFQSVDRSGWLSGRLGRRAEPRTASPWPHPACYAPPGVLEVGFRKPAVAWHETHQLNGRAILSTRGGDARRSRRRATTATRKSGRGAQVTMCGVPGLRGGSSATTTGTNPIAGIGRPKRLDNAHACSARQWRTCSSGGRTWTPSGIGCGLS